MFFLYFQLKWLIRLLQIVLVGLFVHVSETNKKFFFVFSLAALRILSAQLCYLGPKIGSNRF